MARLLTAVAAGSTSAADRFGDRLAANGLWLLGCLAAAAAAVGRGAREYCSPSDYSDAFPHSLLGGWTPCATSLLLTGLPSIVAIIVLCATVHWRHVWPQRGSTEGEHPGSHHVLTPMYWHRLTLVVALFGLAALRFPNIYINVDGDHSGVELWELADLSVFTWTWELVIMQLIDRRTLRCLQEQAPNEPRRRQPGNLRITLMAALALADIIKTMLIARPPWQPVTDANKMMPTLGGLYAGSLVLEAYMLMGIAFQLRLAPMAAAADGSSDMKEPLLADDGTAAVDGTAGGEVEAVFGSAKDVQGEPC